MNKLSLLTLALTVALLPGCCGNKNKSTQPSKKSTVARHMAFEDGEIVEDGDIEDADEDENALEFDFDAEDEDNDDLSFDDLVALEEAEDYNGFDDMDI